MNKSLVARSSRSRTTFAFVCVTASNFLITPAFADEDSLSGLRSIDQAFQQIQSQGVMTWAGDKVRDAASRKFPSWFKPVSESIESVKEAGEHTYSIESRGMDTFTRMLNSDDPAEVSNEEKKLFDWLSGEKVPEMLEDQLPQPVADFVDKVRGLAENAEWLEEKGQEVAQKFSDLTSRLDGYFTGQGTNALEPEGADSKLIEASTGESGNTSVPELDVVVNDDFVLDHPGTNGPLLSAYEDRLDELDHGNEGSEILAASSEKGERLLAPLPTPTPDSAKNSRNPGASSGESVILGIGDDACEKISVGSYEEILCGKNQALGDAEIESILSDVNASAASQNTESRFGGSLTAEIGAAIDAGTSNARRQRSRNASQAGGNLSNHAGNGSSNRNPSCEDMRASMRQQAQVARDTLAVNRKNYQQLIRTGDRRAIDLMLDLGQCQADMNDLAANEVSCDDLTRSAQIASQLNINVNSNADEVLRAQKQINAAFPPRVKAVADRCTDLLIELSRETQ